MQWIVKAAVQKGLSALPNSEAFNYWFQRNVTRGLPTSEGVIQLHIEEAVRHARVFKEHGRCDLRKATFYEFGAGWNLIVPLVYHTLGVEKQILVDIQPHLRFEQVRHSWEHLNRHRAEIEKLARTEIRGFGSRSPKSQQELEEKFGITYLAPRDARDTGLNSGSIDFVSSTYTLEHIPGPDIERILAESARLVGPKGVISCSIDMQDHYSFFDPSVSVYNFLKFSDRVWRLVNSSLHYQNRLRYPDYLKIFTAPGLEVICSEPFEPSLHEIEQLQSITLAPRFRTGYSLSDLATKGGLLVARPVQGATNPA